ncbi:MerR family transcriptional regulator [Halobacillus sp. K22]|uniref:MerR family transcriptional regulator n=1 Tax=Halobacillus sp. K22 TaxID=3457431 RepID=UPI003FCE5131
MVKDLTIAEVAEKFQVTLRTIHYYEEIGLVHPHRKNGHRRYSRKDITRLSLVFCG